MINLIPVKQLSAVIYLRFVIIVTVYRQNYRIGCNLQMGHCHCCPFKFNRKNSEDSLSMDTQNPSVMIQMPKSIANNSKKISQKQINIINKQESAYFKQNHHRIQIETDSINCKMVPLLTPKNIENPSPKNNIAHYEVYSKVKQTIKPQIQKISTMDDEISSNSHSFHNQESQSQSKQESFNQEEPNFKKNKNNMTFSAHQEAIVISREFRTNNDKVKKEQQTKQVELQRLQQNLKHENLTVDEQCQIYYKMAKCQCEMHSYNKCNKHLSMAISQIKDIQSQSLKFYIISLHGYVLLVQKQYAKSIPFLLKAVRMEVAKEGGETIKLVQLYYWLGQAYLNQGNNKFSKEYLSKALRCYNQFSMQDSQLLKALYLHLGILLHQQGQFPQADKFYAKAIRIAQQTKIGNKYFQLLLKKAQNYFSMQSYKLSLSGYANTFKALRKHNLTELPIHQQAKSSLIEVLKAIVSACISQNQLQSVIKSAEECIHDLPQVKTLKNRLKKMRQILYK